MIKTLTLKQLEALNPCNMPARAAMFSGRKSMSIRTAFKLGLRIEDALWLLGTLEETGVIVKFAEWCKQDAEDAASAASQAASAASFAASFAASYASSAASYAASFAASAASAAASAAARAAASAAASAAARDAAIAAAIGRQKSELIRLIVEAQKASAPTTTKPNKVVAN